MKKCTAFVLGGGGARGAFQVGALRALFEAGITPDLLVGSSIGAVNAAALALWGNDLTAVHALELAYGKVADLNILDTNLPRLAIQALTGRLEFQATERTAQFLDAVGLGPELTFADISGVRLAVIGADLDAGQPIIYGLDAQASVQQSVLTSMALPPWFKPMEHDGNLAIDGGALSNLPIEPAMQLGATEIIALDLDDPASFPSGDNQLMTLLGKLISAVGIRQAHLETELAAARGVPVHHLHFQGEFATPVWDFSRHKELIELGYQQTAAWIPTWHKPADSESR